MIYRDSISLEGELEQPPLTPIFFSSLLRHGPVFFVMSWTLPPQLCDDQSLFYNIPSHSLITHPHSGMFYASLYIRRRCLRSHSSLDLVHISLHCRFFTTLSPSSKDPSVLTRVALSETINTLHSFISCALCSPYPSLFCFTLWSTCRNLFR